MLYFPHAFSNPITIQSLLQNNLMISFEIERPDRSTANWFQNDEICYNALVTHTSNECESLKLSFIFGQAEIFTASLELTIVIFNWSLI